MPNIEFCYKSQYQSNFVNWNTESNDLHTNLN